MSIMSRKEEKVNVEQEEPQMAPPEDAGKERVALTEEQEAIEAIRKFTDEDSDDLGDISVKSILGGDFLTSRFMIKQILFVMFCVVLMLLYTGNRYDSQQDAILIDSLRGRLQEVKYNVLTQSSELMNLTRQSNVEKMLKGTPDSLLHNPITPPYLVKSGDERTEEKEAKMAEVLVATPEPVGEEEDPDGQQTTGQEQEKPSSETPSQPQAKTAENQSEPRQEEASEKSNPTKNEGQ